MKKDELIAKQIKYNLNGRGIYKKYPIPHQDKKIMVYGMVKRKYKLQAKKAIQELIKQWR